VNALAIVEYLQMYSKMAWRVSERLANTLPQPSVFRLPKNDPEQVLYSAPQRQDSKSCQFNSLV
jgi:hypothetical protein